MLFMLYFFSTEDALNKHLSLSNDKSGKNFHGDIYSKFEITTIQNDLCF